MNSPQVIIYTADPCPYCFRAKALLKQRGITFEEVLISWNDNEQWDALYERSGGMRTVPQIYVDGKILGGYVDLAALDREDQLKSIGGK